MNVKVKGSSTLVTALLAVTVMAGGGAMLAYAAPADAAANEAESSPGILVTIADIVKWKYQEAVAEAAEDAAEIAPVADQRRDYLRRPVFAAEEKGMTPTEKGTAIHMAMQLIDFKRSSSLDEISEEIERMKTMRLLTKEQAESVDPQKLMNFFKSELGGRALAAEKLYREFKFSVLLPAALVYGRGEGEVLLQGVIDLFFEEDDGIALVDFKSDRVTAATRAARAEEYEGQLSAYAEALTRITGKPVKEKRLFFFNCD